MPGGPSRKRDRALYVEIFIDAPLERVWELTQDPSLHARWDGRFSAIHPTLLRDSGAQEFRYELDLGVHTIRGTGVSLGEKRAAEGSRTSALLFTTEDPLSPLGMGRGYWRYIPEGDGVRFITGYDYAPGWGWFGRIADPLITRRLVWWLTAWSFDRLRIWAEDGTAPERIGWWRGWFGGVRARAGRCRSRPGPAAGRPRAPGAARESGAPLVMDDAPDSLAALSLPESRRAEFRERRRGSGRERAETVPDAGPDAAPQTAPQAPPNTPGPARSSSRDTL